LKTVFVDTGAWIGVAVMRDQTHEAAARYARELAQGNVPLLTTNYVLTEAFTRIRYVDGHAKALAFDALIREMIRRRRLSIAWITPNLHEEAMGLFRRYSDHEFSVVDCASFIAARRRNIREVFGFDHDFAVMGFVLRPS
jgi:predicted nucleic acid-binding protein